MAARNDVTGDSIQTKVSSNQYRDNFDKIFGKKNKKEENSKEESVDKKKESCEDS